jgi:hypothetical protein
LLIFIESKFLLRVSDDDCDSSSYIAKSRFQLFILTNDDEAAKFSDNINNIKVLLKKKIVYSVKYNDVYFIYSKLFADMGDTYCSLLSIQVFKEVIAFLK